MIKNLIQKYIIYQISSNTSKIVKQFYQFTPIPWLTLLLVLGKNRVNRKVAKNVFFTFEYIAVL